MVNRKDRLINTLIRIIIFISSYFPLYIMIVIINYKRFIDVFNFKNILFDVVIIFLILTSLLSLLILKLGSSNRYKKLEGLENTGDIVLSYIMTYVIPLLNIGETAAELYRAYIFLFIMIGYIYLKYNLIYINPLWSIFGYIIYKDSNGEIIITNIPKEKLKYMNVIKGFYISNMIFIAHKKDNLNYI